MPAICISKLIKNVYLCLGWWWAWPYLCCEFLLLLLFYGLEITGVLWKMSGAVRAALKSTTSVCALVQRSHGLLPMRCFSTEAEQPPLNSTPRPPPFFETDHSGTTFYFSHFCCCFSDYYYYYYNYGFITIFPLCLYTLLVLFMISWFAHPEAFWTV